jgi:hypothetical protein
VKGFDFCVGTVWRQHVLFCWLYHSGSCGPPLQEGDAVLDVVVDAGKGVYDWTVCVVLD